MGSCQSQTTNQQQFPAPEEHPIDRQKKRLNTFFYTNPVETQQQAVLSNYKFHSHYTDKFLGDCDILQKNNSKNLYLCKRIKCSNQTELNQRLRGYLQRKQKLKEQNVIQVKQAFKQNIDGFFKEKPQIVLIVDYPFITIQKQQNNRLIKGLEFSKEEIDNIMFSSIKGYAAIEKAGFKNDKVRPKNMFIGIQNRQSLIKVVEGGLLDDYSNLKAICKKGNSNKNKDIYLAPQQFDAYLQKDSDQYYPKAGVYSLGMCMLNLCLLESSEPVYQYDRNKISLREVDDRIAIAGKKYGSITEKFLKDMLHPEPSQRYSFEELQNKIPSTMRSRSNSQNSKMHLSIMPRQKSTYLNNQGNATKSMRGSRISGITGSQIAMYEPGNRTFASGIKPQKFDEDDFDETHEMYTNGNEFRGHKKNGLKEGKGIYTFKDGSYYEGYWKENKMDGKGQLYFPNKRLQYTGEWKEDEYHGWGTLYQPQDSDSAWSKYEGQFKHGVKEGRGKMFFNDGNIYEGEFKGDKIHGRGKVVKPDGRVSDKNWEITNPQFFMS